jgi:hypothetical protein
MTMPDLAVLLPAGAAFFAGGATASGWTAAVIVANSAFDGLDAGRADRHLKRVIAAAAGFQALLMGISATFAILYGAMAAFIVGVVAALGYLSNIWTLAPRREKTVPGARKRTTTQRIVAVALTLLVTAVALTSGVLAVLHI